MSSANPGPLLLLSARAEGLTDHSTSDSERQQGAGIKKCRGWRQRVCPGSRGRAPGGVRGEAPRFFPPILESLSVPIWPWQITDQELSERREIATVKKRCRRPTAHSSRGLHAGIGFSTQLPSVIPSCALSVALPRRISIAWLRTSNLRTSVRSSVIHCDPQRWERLPGTLPWTGLRIGSNTSNRLPNSGSAG